MGDAGECQTSNKKEYDDEDDEAPPAALDEGDIALLKTYGLGPYTTSIKNIEKEINEAKVGVVSNRRGRRLDSRLARPIVSRLGLASGSAVSCRLLASFVAGVRGGSP